MARQRNGFSLVEMVVALAFTMVLMTGMATVFKASLSSSVTSGEVISSSRRNQTSIDMIGSDLNMACMYLGNITSPPTTSATNPPFYILPNMPILQINGTTTPTTAALPMDPVTSDELYFTLDQAFQFDGTLGGTSAQLSAAEMVNGALAPTADDFTYDIDCLNATYAAQVKHAQLSGNLNVIFKDSFVSTLVTAVPKVTGTVVTVVTGANATAAMTGTGPSGLPLEFKHIPGTKVVMILPSQMVRYRVQMLMLDPDPAKPNGIPCLVRDQGTYSAAGFVVDATQPQQIITENVSYFKVYLSINGGQGWAGLDLDGVAAKTGFDIGWGGANPPAPASSIQGELNAQLVAAVTNTPVTIPGSPNWFRTVPTLVRVDVTTRTAAQRTEYYLKNDPNALRNNPGNVANPFRYNTQSLVFVPRHSGLPMD